MADEQVPDQGDHVLTARKISELRALQGRRKRAVSGRFLAEGMRVVEDLVDSPISVAWVLSVSSIEDTERGRELLAAINRRGIPRDSVTDREFKDLSSTEAPQGIIAVGEIPATDLTGLVGEDGPALVLVLDAVQDPGNLGTMIRSAEAFAATGVIVLPGTVDPWNPKVVRSAAGSSFRLPIVHAAWTEASTALRSSGFKLLAADSSGRPLSGPTQGRVALVLGNEGSGVSREVMRGVDAVVGIPTPGRAESLNVTAAAAILLYELSRGTGGA